MNNQFDSNSAYNEQSAAWTTNATSLLVQLYDEKLEMLETPKKKTRIWIAVSENLKDHNINVTPDQVRWKINALTKKYKRCIEVGKPEKFKYFKEMDNIYAKYNVDCDSYLITDFLFKNRYKNTHIGNYNSIKPGPESRAVIEMRKLRLAKRIECDRFQGKVKLEKQWLEFLHKREEQKLWNDKMCERKLKLREQKLEMNKKELEFKKSLEFKNLQCLQKENNDLIEIEREKFKMLKQLIQNYYLNS